MKTTMRALCLLCLPLLLFGVSCGIGCSGNANSEFDNNTTDDDSVQETTLYAAAGSVIITPNPQNHPETIYLGGIYPSRLATGVHDDLEANALALKQGGQQVILVSLDFLGFSRSRIREIQERLAEHGLAQENILISSTHTHEAPDTLGVFGPNVFTSGVSPEYMAFVQDAITNLVLDVCDHLVPVTMTAAAAIVNFPDSNYPTLMADLRQPEITVHWVSAAQFADEQGQPVATLINWHAHPEVMIRSTLISADFPRYVRERVSNVVGGHCVYISGALGGLATPTGVDVPGRNEDGSPMMDEHGNQVYLQDGTWDKARSLGYDIADLAIDAIRAANPVPSPLLQADVEKLLLPVQSPTFILAFLVGLLEFDKQDLVTDQPESCGWFGCTSDRIASLRLGPLSLVTSPGETFPETFIGRTESSYDFGDPWGVSVFPAMDGIMSFMDAPVPMLMSVCGNEVGYLIPETDFHPLGHPDYYEEELCLGKTTETIYRQAAIKMVGGK